MGKIHEASIVESASATDSPEPYKAHLETLLNRQTEMYANTRSKYDTQNLIISLLALAVSIVSLMWQLIFG
jgi:hypothetical protein